MPGVGPVRYAKLLARFGDPAAVLAAPARELVRCELSAETLAGLRQPDWAAVERDLAWLAQPNRHLVARHDPRYPPRLAALRSAPPLLFVHGDPLLLGEPQLAIVGTRNPSPGGRDNAHDFAAHLTAGGLVVTSGLALGIDAAAHRGALSVDGGTTIAVMGTGPDRIYPGRNRDLALAIAERGALVSEWPTGVTARPENFPRRNRLISGLSLGVLVVEAAQQSGSLITARLASEQGREVFAMPGSIHNPLARGCHRLIREGAKLVESARDIIEELHPQLQAALAPTPEGGVSFAESTAPPPPDAVAELDEDYRKLLEQLDYQPVAVDTLVERTGLTADVVSSMLLILELHGFANAVPGGRYVRVPVEER